MELCYWGQGVGYATLNFRIRMEICLEFKSTDTLVGNTSLSQAPFIIAPVKYQEVIWGLHDTYGIDFSQLPIQTLE